MATANKLSPRAQFLQQLNRLHVTAKTVWPLKLLFPNRRRQEIINLEREIAKKNNRLFKNNTPQMKIGSVSANGAIFKMEKKPRYNRGSPTPYKVMKIVKSPGGSQEYAFQKKAARRGISPQVYNLVTGVKIPSTLANKFFRNSHTPGRPVNINAFLMNNLQQSNANKVTNFHNYMKKAKPTNRQAAFNKLKTMVNTMGNHGISHGDLHAGNIYVILSPGKPPKLLIIDFGRSWTVHTMNTRRTAGTANRTKRTATGGMVKNNVYGNLYFQGKNVIPHILNRDKLKQFRNAYGVE
jgi:hypothetical protein